MAASNTFSIGIRVCLYTNGLANYFKGVSMFFHEDLSYIIYYNGWPKIWSNISRLFTPLPSSLFFFLFSSPSIILSPIVDKRTEAEIFKVKVIRYKRFSTHHISAVVKQNQFIWRGIDWCRKRQHGELCWIAELEFKIHRFSYERRLDGIC